MAVYPVSRAPEYVNYLPDNLDFKSYLHTCVLMMMVIVLGLGTHHWA